MGIIFTWPVPMHFPARLAQLRKAQGLSQQRFADLVGLHVNQIKRYEAGTAQPTLDALVSLARALHVNLDALVFNQDERGPQDDNLKLILEAVEQFTPDEKATAKSVLQGLVLQHQARKWAKAS